MTTETKFGIVVGAVIVSLLYVDSLYNRPRPEAVERVEKSLGFLVTRETFGTRWPLTVSTAADCGSKGQVRGGACLRLIPPEYSGRRSGCQRDRG